MDLGTRKQALRTLLNVDHLESDVALIKARKPHSKVLKTKYPTDERKQREVLWDLLSVVLPEDIENNRKFTAAAKEEASIQATKAQELKDKEAAILLANEELKTLVLDEKTDYHQAKRLVKVLAIETENMEKVTLVAALKVFRGDTPEKPEVPAEELEAAKAETEQTQEEKEELQGELDETKSELDETKEQLEEAQSDLEDTQDQLEQTEQALEDTKKNETQNSPKNESTQA